MSTKIYIATILTLLVTLLIGSAGTNGVALASEQNPPVDAPISEKNKLVGQIVAVDSESMTLNTSLFGQVKIYFNDNTEILLTPAGTELTELENVTADRVNPKAIGMGDLAAGQWVIVYYVEIQGQFFAQTIILLDEVVEPDRVQFTGEITAIDLTNGTISLITSKQEVWTVQVDENVILFGEISSLSDLQVGMTITVHGQLMADGTILAKSISSGEPVPSPLFPFHGMITSVDLTAGLFTLQDMNSGEWVNIYVNEETLYFSEGEFVQSLADLQPGMEVKVRATLNPEGHYLAFQVKVLSTALIPVPDATH